MFIILFTGLYQPLPPITAQFPLNLRDPKRFFRVTNSRKHDIYIKINYMVQATKLNPDPDPDRGD